MKIAVINFSGNVGKTTIARHLLLPRIDGAELFSVESLNAADGESHAMRGRQFGELQELLQTIDHAVVDIGASNVEELLNLMQKCQGSHEDFDAFVVPTVPALKQQQDTIATLSPMMHILTDIESERCPSGCRTKPRRWHCPMVSLFVLADRCSRRVSNAASAWPGQSIPHGVHQLGRCVDA